MQIIRIAVTFFVVVATAFCAAADNNPPPAGGPPGLQKKGGVPPGLQKKGGLPPGQAKKQGRELPPADVIVTNPPVTNAPRPAPPVIRRTDAPARTETPRSTTPAPAPTTPPEPVTPAPEPAPTPTPAPVPTPVPPTAPPRLTNAPATNAVPSRPVIRPGTTAPTAQQERELTRELARVNLFWLSPQNKAKAVAAITAESGVTAETLEAQARAYPSLRGGDLLMANLIAARAGQPATDILAAHSKDPRWLAAGAARGVAPEALMEAARRASARLR